ncbi:MAG: leucine-rich repeat protein [Bacteroidales bacterium]|nr:leucine-rich repeat protein [Bacteroidales bacterium]
MKNKKFISKVLSIAICIHVLFTTNALASTPYTLLKSDLTMVNETITGCSYDFSNTNIAIPNSFRVIIKGMPFTLYVEAIMDAPKASSGVFEAKGITNVTLPPALEYIGSKAFYNNAISTVDLSNLANLQYVGANAFASNSLTYIVLPNVALTNFVGWKDGEGNLYNGGDTVRNLATSYTARIAYTLTDADVEVSSMGEITNCSYDFSNTDIVIPDVLDGKNITYIYPNVFQSKGITSLVLPTTLTSIGSAAFANNYLTEIDLSRCAGLVIIGNSAFSNNLLSEVNLSSNTSLQTIFASAFHTNKLAHIDLSACTSLTLISSLSFDGNLLKSFALPTNSTSGFKGWIGRNGAFFEAGSNTDILNTEYHAFFPYTLTDGDVVVNSSGFMESCSYDFSNKSIIIPDTLDGNAITFIMPGVFQQKAINSVILPTTLTSVGASSFANNNLTGIDLSRCPGIVSIGNSAFATNNMSSVILSSCDNLLMIWPSAFASNKLSIIDLSECTSLEAVMADVFLNNYFTKFKLPANSRSNFWGWKDGNGNLIQGGGVTVFDLNVQYTALFGSILNGSVSINGILKYGEELTANVTGSNYTGTLNYQWKRDGTNISGATSNTYVLEEADITTSISVEVTSSTEIGSITGTTTANVEKADQQAPSAPTLAGKTHNSITLNMVSGCEYAIVGKTWQTSTRFTGLLPVTRYDLVQRLAETSTHKASATSSSALSVETEAIPVVEYSVTFNITDGSSAVAGANIVINNTTITTDASGKAVVNHLVADDYSYTVSAQSFYDSTAVVTVEDADVSLHIALKMTNNTSIGTTAEAQVRVYPNPADNVLTINGLKPGVKIMLYDMVGIKIRQQLSDNHATAIDVSNLVSGIYYVKAGNSVTRVIIE